jgi:hypothetical protein
VLIATRHELHGITSTSRQEICHRWIEWLIQLLRCVILLVYRRVWSVELEKVGRREVHKCIRKCSVDLD